jgi:hypothetical protein
MSLTLTLVPAPIALSSPLTSSAVGILTSLELKDGCPDLPAVDTIFLDAAMLLQTLQEHGLSVNKISDQEYTVQTEAGFLRYFRSASDAPFQVEAKRIKDPNQLLHSLDLLENEYGRNVQRFTYETIRCNLQQHGMSLASEEVLEDDTILLTIDL